jgi:microsomal dipeptidase-like Zn-dependent dipeptidase
MTYAQDRPDLHEGESETGNALLSRPAVALIAAGAIGFAVGAVVWQYRRTHPQKFVSFDRAVDMARSGTVDTVQKLRKRLREEGYSPSQIEGRAKKYLSQLIDAAQRRF